VGGDFVKEVCEGEEGRSEGVADLGVAGEGGLAGGVAEVEDWWGDWGVELYVVRVINFAEGDAGREVGFATENIGTGVEACVESIDVVELLGLLREW